ncbi:MAG TPA: pitrilysin family protein [Longimicrobiales bacterium]|nr:pitrilysin family protein [Longimicrobiales bacterium]
MSDQFNRAELDGGLLVLTEEIPTLRSASIGVWVRTGSIHEQPAEMGVSHLLEHMVFKGTQKRSAKDIALVLERLGGSLDAYTTREHTCYQARVLDEHLDTALDVLADLVVSPLLREEDLELEREVVLEEISTVDDTPDDLIFDVHAEALWGDHPYGYSILGTRDTVVSLNEDALKRTHSREYRRPNIVIAGVGNIKHDDVVNKLTRLFEPLPNGKRTTDQREFAAMNAHEQHIAKPTAQTHLVVGTRTFGHGDPRRYALVLLSNAFGGGMSSRLFQRVREELGLAYAVYSFQSFYKNGGISGVYVGTRPEWAEKAANVIREEYVKLAQHGLTDVELDDMKGQVKGQIVLSLEGTGSRLHRLAGTALYDEPYLSVDEMMRRVEAVTHDDVKALAELYFNPDDQVTVRLGPES